MSVNIRGIRTAATPAPRYSPRGTQSDAERLQVAQDWENQLSHVYPLLAQTPNNIAILTAFIADKLFSVQSLNTAVQDNRDSLEWLAPPQPKERTITPEMAQQLPGRARRLGHVDLDKARREADEKRKKELADRESADRARAAANKPKPTIKLVRQNIGEGDSTGNLPGHINRSASNVSTTILREGITVGEFKKLTSTEMRQWIKKFPGKQPRPNPAVTQ